MEQETRNIQQSYWRHADIPYAELRSTYQSQQSYKKHSHLEFSVGAILEGCTQTTILDKINLVQTGELALIEPDLVHSCNPKTGQNRSYHMLYLDTDWCLKNLSGLYGQQMTKINCQKVIVRNTSLFKKYVTFTKLVHAQQLKDARYLLDDLCFHIFSRYCSPLPEAEVESKLVRYVKLRLLDNLVDPPLMDDLATELNLRKETIIRAFSRQLGISPKAFLNNARIEQAKLILKTGAEIIEVALQVGFSDQSHFHKIFVNYTSSTPRQYQKVNF